MSPSLEVLLAESLASLEPVRIEGEELTDMRKAWLRSVISVQMFLHKAGRDVEQFGAVLRSQTDFVVLIDTRPPSEEDIRRGQEVAARLKAEGKL